MGQTEQQISADVRAAKDVVQHFVKVRKSMRIYLQNNEVLTRLKQELSRRFAAFFETVSGPLEITISRNDLTYGDTVVYQKDGTDEDELLFQLYRSGLRSLTFHQGVEKDELFKFLGMLNQTADQNVQDDLVTLLWSGEFRFIQYYAIDDYLEEGGAEEGMKALEARVDSPTPLPPPNPEAAGPYNEDVEMDLSRVKADQRLPREAAGLSERETALLLKEVEEHDTAQLLKTTVEIALEAMVAESTRDQENKLTEVVIALGQSLIDEGDFKTAAQYYGHIDQLSRTEFKSVPQVLRVQQQIKFTFANPAHWKNLAGLLNDVFTGDLNDIPRFLALIPDTAMPELLNQYAQIQSPNLRKAFLDGLLPHSEKNGAALVNFLGSAAARPVLREVIALLGRAEDPKAVEMLGKYVRDPDPRIRREAVFALGRGKSNDAANLLVQCLDDEDLEIRTTALRNLMSMQANTTFPRLKALLERSDFEEREFQEKMRFSLALAKVGSWQSVSFFAAVLNRKSLFSGKNDVELKLCAVQALGSLVSVDGDGDQMAFSDRTDRAQVEQLLRTQGNNQPKPVREKIDEILKSLDRRKGSVR
ncbi:MAG: hypothetical protein GMKNLPBB_01462 [Myxococcota bacterium]|nr:hypothetical protein [Myxococcota bacterium]